MSEATFRKYVQLGWSRDSVVQGGTIVGIVGDVRQFSIAREAIPELYLPFAQTPVGRMTSVIRTTADPAVIQAAVRAQVRAIDANLPVKKVYASRGKYLRAEPVAALYAEGRVAHVGDFPALERQMCDFAADGLSQGRSPDRLDALVWALTELMLVDQRNPQIRVL